MKERLYQIAILVLVVVAEFFALRYWRDEQVLQQAQTIAQQGQVLQQTNAMLNQIQWSEAGRNEWTRLGYVIQPKSSVLDTTKA